MKNFIPHKKAVALKELGFNEDCIAIYENQDEKLVINYNNCLNLTKEQEEQKLLRPGLFTQNNKNSNLPQWATAAPLFQEVFEWFRKEHGLHAEPIWDNCYKTYWFFNITQIGNTDLKDSIFLEDARTEDTKFEDGFLIELKWVDSYEEAELNAINKLIEIVKDKKLKKGEMEDKKITLPSGMEFIFKLPDFKNTVELTPIEKTMKDWAKLIEEQKTKKNHYTVIEGIGRFLNLKPVFTESENEVSITFEYENNPVFESKKERSTKSLFETYFDGCYGVDSTPNTPSTYSMGVCKLEFCEKENELTVHLRRPGLLIGKAGRTINALEKYLECKVKIKEVKKF